MPERVSRIPWRKGSPLALCISPSRSFLDLPRELRDTIYRLSLSAPEPIMVWSGIHRSEGHRGHDSSGRRIMRSCATMTEKAATLDHLATSLFLCNRQVALEAAAAFYRWNTFCFMGDRVWSPFYVFLQTIGKNSRDSLRSVELQMSQPRRVWQHEDGTRTSLNDWPFGEVIAQSPYLQRNSPPFDVGEVDHIDPAIEACFRILGKDRSPLSLVLVLDTYLIPGLALPPLPYSGRDSNFRLDLPVAIERCRQELTASPGATGVVEVLWKGEHWSDEFTSQTDLIHDKGWVIVEAKERDSHLKNKPILTTMLFTLRRKEDWVEPMIKDS